MTTRNDMKVILTILSTHSEILKNIFVKYRIYYETLIVIDRWGGVKRIF